MADSFFRKVEKTVKHHKKKSMWTRVVMSIAMVVVFITTYMLILPAITMEKKTICGKEEHQHTEACYKEVPVTKLLCEEQLPEIHQHTKDCYDDNGNLICGYADFILHTHTKDCYNEDGDLICPLEENKGHKHTKDCYDKDGNLICGEAESYEAHTHTKDCYKNEDGTISKVPVCGKLEVYEHVHNEKCFPEPEKELICGKEEHVHTKDCYADDEENDVNKSTEGSESTTEGAEESTGTKDAEKGSTESGTAESRESTQEESTTEAGTETETAKNKATESEKDTQASTGGKTDTVSGTESDIDEDEITQQDEYCIVRKLEATGTKAAKIRRLARSAIATQSIDANSIDFSGYITEATVSKLENGEWKPSTEFKEGDQVRVNIKYTLPSGKVNSTSKTIYYQLPSGVHPVSEETGPVYQGGEKVGTYKIGTDGLIEITFDDAFAASGDAFSGDIQFKGTLSKTSDADSEKISFGGDTNTITIKKESAQYDIAVKKTGELESDGSTVDYTITASTTKGTENTVTIKDVFQQSSAKGAYVRDSFKIYKVDKDGNKTEVTDHTPTFGIESNGEEKFEIADLPKLEAGEKYEVSYKATTSITSTDGAGTVKNSGGAISGNQNKWDWKEVEVSKAKIYKNGWYDSETGLITWTVTVNQDKKDIGGYTFTDTLPENLVGNAVIKDSSGNKVAEITPDSNRKLSYTFANGSKDTYTITYKTKAPDQNGTVSNTGHIGKDGKDYSSGKDVGVSHRDWGLSKQWNGEEDSNGKHYYKWQSIVTLPDKALTSFTYTDTIKQATHVEGTSTPDENSHYAIASELQKQFEDNLSIRLKVNGEFKDFKYNNDYVTFTVNYFDKDGNKVEANDSSTHVQKFTITITPKEAYKNIIGSKLTLNYSTIVDFSKMNEGDTWKFVNNGSIPDKDSSADHTYTKPKTIEKQAGVNKGSYIEYNDGTTKVDYDTANGILYYRLFLRTEKNSNGEITLTDELPAGATLVADSVQGAFYDNQWYIPTSCGNYNFNGAQKITVTQDEQKVTMKIAAGYNECGKVGSAPGGNVIVVTYQANIKDDSFWNNLANESKTYTNKVTWNGNSVEQNTKVDRNVEKVEKSAKQLVKKSDDGKEEYTNTVAYSIVINPGAKDLLPEENTLTLTDTMSVPDGVDAYLDLESVHLYQYDAQKENNIGTELDSSRYQFTYDQKTHKIILKLPDELACVFVYNYNVDVGNKAEPQLSNKVSLIGEYDNKTETKIKTSDSSATVTKGKLTIYKVDQDNYKKSLSGAEFKLEYWDEDSNSWKTQADKLTTNSNGEITLDAEERSDLTLKLNAKKLYRLTETKAPSGYSATGDIYYFIYKGPKQSGKILTDQEAYNAAKAQNSGIQQNNIVFYGADGGSLYVPNDYTQVSVKKVWVDNDNRVTGPGADSVKVKLYRQSTKLDGYTLTVNIAGRGNELTRTEVIQKNSPVTVRLDGWNNEYTIEDDQGNVTKMNSSNKGSVEFKIDSLTKDTTLNITSSNNYNVTPTIEKFRAADYVASEDKTLIGEVVELSEDNKWTKVWSDLKVRDDEGKPYLYTVEEVDPPSGSSVSYTNNNGIQTGDITITNKISTYSLPETGGTGTILYIGGGLLLMVAAGVLMYINQKNKRRDSAL